MTFKDAVLSAVQIKKTTDAKIREQRAANNEALALLEAEAMALLFQQQFGPFKVAFTALRMLPESEAFVPVVELPEAKTAENQPIYLTHCCPTMGTDRGWYEVHKIGNEYQVNSDRDPFEDLTDFAEFFPSESTHQHSPQLAFGAIGYSGGQYHTFAM